MLKQFDEFWWRGGGRHLMGKEMVPNPVVPNAWCWDRIIIVFRSELAVLMYSLSFIQFSLDTNRVLARSYTSHIQWKSISNKVKFTKSEGTKT